MLWKYDYYCPNCDHRLTTDNDIHFAIETKRNERANIHLSTIPGEYGYQSEDDLTLTEGEEIQFFCQSCKENLRSSSHPEFVEINMKVSEEIIFEVFFSPVYGDRSTYVLMEYELVKYGDDFFGALMDGET